MCGILHKYNIARKRLVSLTLTKGHMQGCLGVKVLGKVDASSPTLHSFSVPPWTLNIVKHIHNHPLTGASEPKTVAVQCGFTTTLPALLIN